MICLQGAAGRLGAGVAHGRAITKSARFNRVAELGKICRERGVLFHTDAVQWFGKEPFTGVQQFNADFVSVCAHKFHGPKGAGALFIKSLRCIRTRFLFGGSHENERVAPGRKIGVAAIAGFVEALEKFVVEPVFFEEKLAPLSSRLIRLIDRIPGVQFIGPRENRLSNTVSFLVEGADSISLLAESGPRGHLRFRVVRRVRRGRSNHLACGFGSGIQSRAGSKLRWFGFRWAVIRAWKRLNIRRKFCLKLSVGHKLLKKPGKLCE